MKVENHYSTLGQNGYKQPHSHHMTECLYEEEAKKWEGELGGKKTGQATELSGGVIYEKAAYDNISLGKRNTNKKEEKPGLSLVKGFWESLGEEGGKEGRQFQLPSFQHTILPGIAGAVSAFSQRLSGSIAGSVKVLRSRIKTEISAALKRFGKGQEAFTALSDQRTPSHQKNPYSGAGNRKEPLRAGNKEEIPMKPLVHSHLMDSYSKTGAYCQINENLTYQKPGGKPRENFGEQETGKESGKEPLKEPLKGEQ